MSGSLSVGAFSQREMGRLRAQVLAGVGQAAARQLEGRVRAQPVEVVAVGIAAADRQHPGSEHVGNGVRDMIGIARIGDVASEGFRDTAPTFREPEQHDARCRRTDGHRRTKL